jgi:ribose 5-phosphate isomerase A
MTLRALAPATVRDVPLSPDGGVIADYEGDVGDPAALAARLAATPGVVDHGLFDAALVTDILIARGGGIEHRHETNRGQAPWRQGAGPLNEGGPDGL